MPGDITRGTGTRYSQRRLWAYRFLEGRKRLGLSGTLPIMGEDLGEDTQGDLGRRIGADIEADGGVNPLRQGGRIRAELLCYPAEDGLDPVLTPNHADIAGLRREGRPQSGDIILVSGDEDDRTILPDRKLCDSRFMVFVDEFGRVRKLVSGRERIHEGTGDVEEVREPHDAGRHGARTRHH